MTVRIEAGARTGGEALALANGAKAEGSPRAPAGVGSTRVLAVRAAPRTRILRLALAGCGVVGSALVRLILERGAGLEVSRGLRLEIARVLVRHPERERGLGLPQELFTADPGALLAEDADVLVEAMGGLHPAERLARATLERGRSLVTANKALVAAAGVELAALAEAGGGRFDFEAAVAGGVPVIRALRGSLGESGVTAVRGVLNGTTNYLLGRLADGASYAAALAEAQAKGFAEADPTRDLDGTDAAAKLAILAWLAFGCDPSRLRIRQRGLLPHPELLGAAAGLFGGVPKLVGECVRAGGGVDASVEPAVVWAVSELGSARAENNVVIVDSRWNGRVALTGPGAGGTPTASALFSDILAGAGPATPLASSWSALGAVNGGKPTGRAGNGEEDATPVPWIVALDERAAGRAAAGGHGPAALKEAFASAGIVATDRRLAGGVAAARTGAVPWARVALAAARLTERGYASVVLRDSRNV